MFDQEKVGVPTAEEDVRGRDWCRPGIGEEGGSGGYRTHTKGVPWVASNQTRGRDGREGVRGRDEGSFVHETLSKRLVYLPIYLLVVFYKHVSSLRRGREGKLS